MSLSDKLNQFTKRLIAEDGITIIDCVSAFQGNGSLSLSLLPFLALYCRSAQEYFGQKVIDDKTEKQITDIRNGLKIYSNRYGKIKNTMLTIDSQQDQYYKDQLRFSFMKKWNINYNLGVYFDEAGHIVGNTQLSSLSLTENNSNFNIQNQHALEIGRILGAKTVFILKEFCGLHPTEICLSSSKDIRIGYRDYNTNRSKSLFSKHVDKDLNLTILHLLSLVGFVEHILRSTLPSDNPWLFRTEYVVAHYVWSGMKRIAQHLENNTSNTFDDLSELHSFVTNGSSLFPSSFRNCMMHYDLNFSGKPVIADRFYNPHLPFCGLIESCFNGKPYDEFFFELRQYILALEKHMSSWFNIDIKSIKWDL